MRNPFQKQPPEAKALKNFLSAYAEAKSYDVLPEGMWQQLVAAQDMGGSIGLGRAVGLPAVLAVIRFLSHAAGLVPLNVIRDSNVRERAIDTWQWNLLNRRPGPPPMTPFNFQADIAANFAGRGNAYIRKFKPTTITPRLTRDTPRVTQLMNLHAGAVQPKLADSGLVTFKDSTGKVPVDRGTDEIIQIRSFSVEKDGLTGVSPITSARLFVEAGLKRNLFEERHLTNGIAPSLAVNFGRMDEDQANRWLDFIEQRHKGSGKAGKLIGVPKDATITQLPISLADALFADMTRLTMEQACAMYQIPLAILNASPRLQVTDDDYRYFTTWALGPLLIATAQAFEADDDLFEPNSTDDNLSVSPDTDALLKLDALKKAQVGLSMVQSGQRLADELRAEDGYGPLPPIPKDWTEHPGQVPQITPVGGAPNPEADTSAKDPAQQNLNDGAKV